MTQITSAATAATPRRSAWAVITLCWLIVVFDGYDLIVYGTTLPNILKEPGWSLTPASGGTVGSLAFLGMLVGALVAGSLADRLGRRRTILACTAWFSVATALCAVAPNAGSFGLLRFLAGLGLGGLVPSANALTTEFVAPKFRATVSTVMMSGVPLGGSLAAVLGKELIPASGWRVMYAVALIAVIVVLPACFAWLPESPHWLQANGRAEDAARIRATYGLPDERQEATPEEAGARQGLGAILRDHWLLPTLLFAGATTATLFAWYGLGTWLPKLMGADDRFDMGQPLNFLLALNLGAIIGSFVTAALATRLGPLSVSIGAAAVAAVALAYLLTYPASLTAIYGALILAGIGTHGTQCLIIAAVASHYPAHLRGTSLGFALGIGRIGAVAAPQVGGWILSAGGGVGGNFAAFSAAAALAAVLLVVTFAVTRSPNRTDAPVPGTLTDERTPA